MKKNIKRLIGLLLVTVLLITMVPLSTLAKPATTGANVKVKTAGIASENVTSDESANDLDSSVNGIVQCPDGRWAMYKNGKVDTSCTSIEQNKYGWWRVKDGYVDFEAQGIYQNRNGWWKTTNGKVTFKEFGLFENENGTWRVEFSKVNFKANSIYQGKDGWYKTANGKVTFDETGVFQNQFGWWYVNNSKVDFDFTGIASNNFGKWYIKTGKVDFTKIGKAEYNGNTYLVMFGKALQITDNKEKVTVTFIANADNVTNMPEPINVIVNESIAQPSDPQKEGYYFVGWFVDSAGTEKYNFSSPVTDNLVLYAKWIIENDGLNDDIIDREDIETLEAEGAISLTYDESGKIIVVKGELTNQKVLSTKDASDLLNSAKVIFGNEFNASTDEFEVQTSYNDSNLEQFHYTYSPIKDGVPVLGGQIIVSTDNKGNVIGLTNAYDSKIDETNTSPVISKHKAEEIAVNNLLENETIIESLNDMAKESNETLTELQDRFQSDLVVDSELVIVAFDDSVSPSLAYEVTITDVSPDPSKSEFPYLNVTYYVSAEDTKGLVLYQTDNMEYYNFSVKAEDLRNQTRVINVDGTEGQFGSSYSYYDGKRNIDIVEPLYLYPIGFTLTGSDTNSNSSAVSALANMSDVYDFYYDVLGHKSFDNQGSKLYISLNNVSWYNPFDKKDNNHPIWFKSCENAGFGNIGNKAFISFGNKGHLHAALDICAHEYTHGVIGSIKPLIGFGPPRALEESYADIMGNLIEGKTGSDKWLLGEDADNGPTRDMKNPELYNQPAHIDDYYVCTEDEGGKHTNSGIVNHAAYLMMSDSRTSNISNEKWAKVFYNSLYDLPNTASFLIAREEIVQSAENLGFSNDQIQAIKDAFDAVGIRDYSNQQLPNDDTTSDDLYSDFSFGSDPHIEPIPLSDFYVSSDGINDYYKYPNPINYLYEVTQTDFLTNEDSTYYYIGCGYSVPGIYFTREHVQQLDNNNQMVESRCYANGGMYIKDLGKWYRFTLQIGKDNDVKRFVNIDFKVLDDTDTKLISSEGTSLKVGSPTKLKVVNEVEPYNNFEYTFYAINEDTQRRYNIPHSTDIGGLVNSSGTWVPEKAGNYTLYVYIRRVSTDGPPRTLKLQNVTVKE